MIYDLSYQFTDMVVRWLAQQESPGFIHIFVQRHAYRLTSDSKWMDDVCVNFKQGDVIRVKTDDITGYALVRVWLAKSPPHGCYQFISQIHSTACEERFQNIKMPMANPLS